MTSKIEKQTPVVNQDDKTSLKSIRDQRKALLEQEREIKNRLDENREEIKITKKDISKLKLEITEHRKNVQDRWKKLNRFMTTKSLSVHVDDFEKLLNALDEPLTELYEKSEKLIEKARNLNELST